MELHKESKNHLRLGLYKYHHVCKAVVHHPDLLKKPRNDVLASHPMFSTHRRCFNCTILPPTYKTHRKFPQHSIVELETLTRTTLTLILHKPISIHPWPKSRSYDHRQLTLLWATYASRAILMRWGSCLFVAVEAAATQARNAERRGIPIAQFRHASARSFTRTYCGLNAFQVRPETKFLEIKLPRVVTTLNWS